MLFLYIPDQNTTKMPLEGEVLKREKLLNCEEIPCKKLLALILIIVFFIQINCNHLFQKSGLEKNYHVCRVEYVQGSSNMPSGKGGILFLFSESMLFEHEDSTLEIPYQNIYEIRYNDHLKNVINNYHEWSEDDLIDFDFSLGQILLGVAVIIAVVTVVVLLLLWSRGYTYIDITYENGGQSQWCTFIIGNKDIDKIKSIMNEKRRWL